MEKHMTKNSLEKFIDGVGSVWGPLTSELVAGCRQHLEELLKAPATEEWLAALHRDAPASSGGVVYEFFILIQRVSDGAIGIIDPEIENQDLN